MGQPEEAHIWLDKSLEVWQNSDNTFNETLTFMNLGSVETSLGHYSQAEYALQQAYSLCEQSANRELLADVQIRLSTLYGLTREYTNALSCALEAAAVRGRHPQAFLQCDGLACLGLAYALNEEFEAARKSAEQALHIAQRIRHPIALFTALNAGMQVFDLAREPQRARALAQQLYDLAEQHEAYEYLVRALLHRAEYEDNEAATDLAGQAIEIAEERGLALEAFQAASSLCNLNSEESYEAKRRHWAAYLKRHAPEGRTGEEG